MLSDADTPRPCVGQLCKGKRHLGVVRHPCPYDEDVNDDHNDKCNCCPECERQCAEDV